MVIVGHREPNDDLYQALLNRPLSASTLSLVGDAQAPGAIAHAVYSGHAFARALIENNSSLYLRDEPMNSVTPESVFARG